MSSEVGSWSSSPSKIGSRWETSECVEAREAREASIACTAPSFVCSFFCQGRVCGTFLCNPFLLSTHSFFNFFFFSCMGSDSSMFIL